MLRDEGVSQLEIYMLYEHFLKVTDADSERYDRLYEIMDFIWGYPPYVNGQGLFDHTLSNEELAEYRSQY